jgi:hypothetical protein
VAKFFQAAERNRMFYRCFVVVLRQTFLGINFLLYLLTLLAPAPFYAQKGGNRQQPLDPTPLNKAMYMLIAELVNLFFAGLLAGVEFAVHYGFHSATVALEERPQIQLRQGVIRRLRVLVPPIFAGAFFGNRCYCIRRWGTGFAFSLCGPAGLTHLDIRPGSGYRPDQ